MKNQLHALDKFLIDFTELWRPQPFKQIRPAWCVKYPALTQSLLNLSDHEVEFYEQNNAQLLKFVGQYIPELKKLDDLCKLQRLSEKTLSLNEAKFGWEVPGRKKIQIEAFTQAITCADQPVLEWCGGKGHLGRSLALLWQQPVQTLEWHAELCQEGQRLSERAGVNQIFHVQDVLQDSVKSHLGDKHVVALHACGDLHRRLVQFANAEQVKTLDIAPCCYHLGKNDVYIAFNRELNLKLKRDDLRLAVTNTATAIAAEIRKRNQEMAWKLGYDSLRRSLLSSVSYKNIKPIKKVWLKLSFAEFCQQLAKRENLDLPADINWQEYEQKSWQRQHEVMRLNLLRFLFRRAIEVWLVLDMVIYLQQQGYQVQVKEFCERHVSPRNILLSARRE